MSTALIRLLTATALSITSPRPAPFPTDTVCQKLGWGGGDTIPDGERKTSPLDSVTFKVGGRPVKICYGRPSLRGRTMIGGRGVPYGLPWRTGANEPTIFFTPTTLSLAGLKVPPGTYSLYTIPGETEWTIVVTRSYRRWGSELNRPEVTAQEVGRVTIGREWIPFPVETLTIRTEPAATNARAIVIEWERTRVRVPVASRAP